MAPLLKLKIQPSSFRASATGVIFQSWRFWQACLDYRLQQEFITPYMREQTDSAVAALSTFNISRLPSCERTASASHPCRAAEQQEQKDASGSSLNAQPSHDIWHRITVVIRLHPVGKLVAHNP